MGPLGVAIRVYVSPDENPAQVRKEVLSKKLQTFIGTLLQEEVWCKQETGTFLVNKRKVVSVVIVDEHSSRLDWFVPTAAALKLDMAAIELHFKSEVCSFGGGQSP